MSDELKFKNVFAFHSFVCDFTRPGIKDNYAIYVVMFIHIITIQNK